MLLELSKPLNHLRSSGTIVTSPLSSKIGARLVSWYAVWSSWRPCLCCFHGWSQLLSRTCGGIQRPLIALLSRRCSLNQTALLIQLLTKHTQNLMHHWLKISRALVFTSASVPHIRVKLDTPPQAIRATLLPQRSSVDTRSVSQSLLPLLWSTLLSGLCVSCWSIR